MTPEYGRITPYKKLSYLLLFIPIAMISSAMYFSFRSNELEKIILSKGTDRVGICDGSGTGKGPYVSFVYYINGKEFSNYSSIYGYYSGKTPVGKMFRLRYLPHAPEESILKLSEPVNELQEYGKVTNVTIITIKQSQKNWKVQYSYYINGKEITETKRYYTFDTIKYHTFSKVNVEYSEYRIGKELPPLSDLYYNKLSHYQTFCINLYRFSHSSALLLKALSSN
ncbi:MAG TPA: hypothetical protein VEC36_00440 [Patescibacteria group bacterium]|nr:hypothetical protein [Patescibacteria group bacterium]